MNTRKRWKKFWRRLISVFSFPFPLSPPLFLFSPVCTLPFSALAGFRDQKSPELSSSFFSWGDLY